MTELRAEDLTLPGVRLGPENPLPFFRDPQVDRPVAAHPSLPQDKRQHLGWQTGFRVLPYRMQDSYTRQREPIVMRALVLENEILKATFLPELGGRLISLVYKPQDRELLSRNAVFQPANLAIRNAWFSGGIEWNCGQYGHAFTTCSPLFAAAITDEQGEPGLRLYEFERCKGLFWQVDFRLPAGSPFLLAYVRVANPSERDTSLYWWTNTAVQEAPGVRVLAPARQAIYRLSDRSFGYTELPYIPSFGQRDGTYSVNSPNANEFFFQCETSMPWEAALDEDGSGLVEGSTSTLRYRKMFCWGMHQGGRHWQEFLGPGSEPYLEIQAGLAPTQLHGLPMPARADWSWLQVFGFLEADPKRVHGPDWETAWQTVDHALKNRLPEQQLYDLAGVYRRQADSPASAILHEGSGWGALEMKRRAKQHPSSSVPASFVFPESTLGPEQEPWLHLLAEGSLGEQSPEMNPGAWMVQDEWRHALERSLDHPQKRTWYALLHYGVMLAETFDDAGAMAAWRESIARRPSAWAYRNLAVVSQRLGRSDDARRYYEQAWALARTWRQPEVALAQEYMQLLCTAGSYSEAAVFYASLAPALQAADRVQTLRGRAALELGDLAAVEDVLQRQYSVVREGEIELTDLWFGMWEKRLASESGRAVDAALRQVVRQMYPPPAAIDFRSAP